MSIGPSLQARDRATTTSTDASTDAPTDAPADASMGATSFALRYAKRSFEPFNTDPCPRMFADKWASED